MSLRRVLLVQPYGIGDLLFLTPILRALRLIPGIETVDLLLGSRTEAVVRNNPHIDQIFSVDKDRIHRQTFLQNFKELKDLGGRLSKRRYDLLLDFSLRGEYAFCGAFFLGIPKRAGLAYKNRAVFHNIRLPLEEGFSKKHVVDYYCDLAEAVGIRVEDRFLEFYPSDEDRRAVREILSQKCPRIPEKILVVSPGGGESWGKDAHFKRWRPDYFSAFIQKLRGETDFDHVFIVGSAGEKALGDEIIAALDVPALNMAGDLSLGTTAALLERAKLFIGNDGGLMHLAGALHVPVIAFYGPVDPAVYGPYASSVIASEAEQSDFSARGGSVLRRTTQIASSSRLGGTPRNDGRTVGNIPIKSIAVYKESLACRPCYQRFRYNSACEKRECLQELTPEEAMRFLKQRDYFSLFKKQVHA